MMTEQDKILMLKTVPIFAQTPEETLSSMVDLLEDVQVKAGESIFEKGDIGSSMYIVVDGKVRVHDGELTLNYLDSRAVFGEMAALDPEPRSATVSAVKESYLFRLDQKALYQLIEQHEEVTRGIVRVLCQRLRDRMRDLAEDFAYRQQFARVTAAASAVEAGMFDTSGLQEVAERSDQLGQLARVFQRMTHEVYAREERLRQEAQDLRIQIDRVKKDKEVQEIVNTDYFKDIQQKMKKRRASSESSES